jgi:hypothetical protein
MRTAPTSSLPSKAHATATQSEKACVTCREGRAIHSTCRLLVRRSGASSHHLALDIERGARRTIRETMQPDRGWCVGNPCLRIAHRPLGFAATSAPGRSIGSWPLP